MQLPNPRESTRSNPIRASPQLHRYGLGLNAFAGRGQPKESAKVVGGFNTHDEALQLFTLILANDIAAERREFYSDFFLCHWIARTTLGNIDTEAERYMQRARAG
jgi:hypothetical protein